MHAYQQARKRLGGDCMKRSYALELSALLVAAERSKEGVHIRAYFCRRCQAWHLTSSPFRLPQAASRRSRHRREGRKPGS